MSDTGDKDPWVPEGAEADPAFQVQRIPYGGIEGGDYVRARSGLLAQTALRYNTQRPGWSDLTGKSLVSIRPFNYTTLEITWGWPTHLGNWHEVALVRSSFGRPSTPNDGQTLFRTTWSQLQKQYLADDGVTVLAPLFYDGDVTPPMVLNTGVPLRSGYWYYYTLFFRTTELDWVPGMSMGSPVPRNYGHSEHLWNHTPPWYQFQDSQMRAGVMSDDGSQVEGFLRQFYNIFGFELDLTREYVEQWQKLYHIDFVSRRLLLHLGYNFDTPYEPGLGDIRYRGLVGSTAQLHRDRGTRKGLKALIEAASQYECDIIRGDNLMLTPQDSEFLGGTGNWSAPHHDLVPPSGSAPDPTWGKPNIFRQTRVRPTTEINPPPNEGRAVIEVFVTEIENFVTYGPAYEEEIAVPAS